MPRLRPSHPARAALRIACVPLVLALSACQPHQRQPLDLPGHHAAFLARTPDNPGVRAFAASLAPRDADATGFDPADGVSCAEAEVLALVFNADLRLARLRAGVTRATADHAGLWEDPTIGVDLARVVESTPEPWKAFASLGLTIPISGRLDAEKRRAGAEHAAELARVAREEWSTRVRVRRAWSEWSALTAHLAALRDFLARVDRVLGIVDRMEQAGETARTEARLFRIERATTAADLALLESQAQQAELVLRQLMGMSPDAPLTLAAGGIGPAHAVSDHAQGATGRALLELRTPVMLVASAEYEAAEHALALEVRKQYPDLHIGPGLGTEDGQGQVLLGLSLPVPILNANAQGIAEARARRDLARAGAEAALEQVVAGVRAAEARLRAASQRRNILETEIVPLVDAQEADAREVARLGEVNTLVLLESLTRQQSARAALIAARRDEALALADLDELLGPPPADEHAPAAPTHTTEPTPSSDTPD